MIDPKVLCRAKVYDVPRYKGREPLMSGGPNRGPGTPLGKATWGLVMEDLGTDIFKKPTHTADSLWVVPG